MDAEMEPERLNMKVLHAVNARGEVFISHTRLKGRYCLRLAIGSLQTNDERVRRAFNQICYAGGIEGTSQRCLSLRAPGSLTASERTTKEPGYTGGTCYLSSINSSPYK
jgi:hypothetical protein